MPQFQKYVLAFDITPLPMLMVSKSGEIILANQLFGDLFEYEVEQLIGNNVEMLIPEMSRNSHPQLRDGYFARPSKRTMGHGRELTGITRTGSVIALELGLDTVTVEDEVHAMVIALDITARKRNEQHMNVVMRAATSAMIMVNNTGSIVFVNKAALALFGYEEHQLLGCPIEKLVPEDVQGAHPPYRDTFMKNSAVRSMGNGLDIFALHKDGHHIPVDIALTPVETPDGKMVVSTVIDLTERVSAEIAMAEKTAQFERANLELQQFAYSASHDLKAPITTIVGLLGFCVEDLEEDNIDELRSNILRALDIGRRSVRKVETVLEISRVGLSPIKPQLIDLEHIIGQIWLDLTSAHQGQIVLDLGLRHTTPIYLELKTLNVIIENLLSNAIRYSDDTKPVKTVTVRSSCHDNCLQVRVMDNGIGIPEKSKDAVYDMFGRISERSDHGLGLSLVKKHINRLNGVISFDSTEGKGTEFQFSLPLLSVETQELDQPGAST